MSLLTRAVGSLTGNGKTVSAETDPTFHKLRHTLDKPAADDEPPINALRAGFENWATEYGQVHSPLTLEESAWLEVLSRLLDGQTRTVYEVLGMLERSDLWAGHTIPLFAESMPSAGVDTALLAPVNFALRRLPFGRYLMRAAKVANLGRVLFHDVQPADLKQIVKAVAAKLTEKRLSLAAQAP